MIFTEEQREIQALVHAFAEKEIRPLSRKYDELGEFPMELYKKACRMQLNCLDLPEKYGGTGVSKVTSCLIREELSWGDAGFSLSLGANGLGFSRCSLPEARRSAGTLPMCCSMTASPLLP